MKMAIVKVFTILMLIVSTLVNTTYAQDKKDSGLGQQSLQDAAIVGGCGLAGAILGLSTLSFVDEPKDHTKNILTGAAIGIVAGVVVVAYNQANQTSGIMGTSAQNDIDAKDFSLKERLVTAEEIRSERAIAMINDPIQFSVNVSF